MTCASMTRSLTLLAALSGTFALGATSASADVTKAQCVDANTSAQTSRRAGKLALAREQLRLCGDPHCPRIVRDDCTRRLEEVDNAQPSIVFDVKDAAGGDIGDVEVTVDGQVVTHKLDGTAVAVDPGSHTFGFRVDEEPPTQQILVVKEGEKSRRLTVTLGHPLGVEDPPPPKQKPPPPKLEPPTPPPQPPAERSSAATVASVALAGAGVVGLGLGTIFGVLASSKWSAAKSACGTPTTCPGTGYADAVSDHDASVTDGTVATAAFIAGGALLAGGAAVYFFSAPSSDAARSSSSARVHVVPRFAPGSAGLEIGGTL
jgi:hypothetical protein